MVKQQFLLYCKGSDRTADPKLSWPVGQGPLSGAAVYCGLRAAAEMVRLGLYRAASSEGACLDIHSFMHP